jgi:hypothetical protein
MFADGTTGNEQYRGQLAYNHSTDAMSFATSGSGRLIIDGSGNVGIGISGTSPNAKLQVKDSSDSGFDSGIGITRSASTQTGYINMVGGAMNFNSPAIPFTFRQSGLEKMRLDSAGNLGLGVTSITAKLQVNGSFSIQNGSGLSESKTQTQYTSSVLTTATIILTTVSDGMSSAMVSKVTLFGNNNAGKGFYDEVLIASNNSKAPQVITALNTGASTADSRTYTVVSNQLKLSMGATGYSVNVKSEGMGYPF